MEFDRSSRVFSTNVVFEVILSLILEKKVSLEVPLIAPVTASAAFYLFIIYLVFDGMILCMLGHI